MMLKKEIDIGLFPYFCFFLMLNDLHILNVYMGPDVGKYSKWKMPVEILHNTKI